MKKNKIITTCQSYAIDNYLKFKYGSNPAIEFIFFDSKDKDSIKKTVSKLEAVVKHHEDFSFYKWVDLSPYTKDINLLKIQQIGEHE